MKDKGRDEHREDAEHGQEARRGRGRLARRAATATESVWRICECVFSMVTVASSTRMPIASASPPSDMMLMRVSRQPQSHQTRT